MNKINMYIETKKALFVNHERVTDYIYDEILETANEFILYSEAIINIYDKNTGEKLFEYVPKNECEIFRFTTDFFYIEKNDKVWLYTTRGKKFSKNPFDDFFIPNNYEDLRRIIVYRENKQGVYSFEGEKIVACEYNEIKLYKNAIEAYIEKENKTTHIYSLNGILIFTAIKYDDQWWTIPAGIVKQNSKGKCGLYSLDGKIILSEIYDEIMVSDMYDYTHLEAIRVKKDGKYGVFDFKGNSILPIEYESIRISEGIPHSCIDCIRVKKDGKYGIYSHDGTLKIPIEYEYFKSYHRNDSCQACKDGIWGFYIISKKKFIAADEINITKTGKYEILFNGEWKMIEI